MSERCVCCGGEIPEGRQVCPRCAGDPAPCQHLWQFDGFETKRTGRYTRWRCAKCGAEREESVTPRELLYQEEKKYSGLLEED